MLDIRVCYGKTPENSYAIADVDSYHPRIVMNESRIETGDHAARVLGHEIGHFLVEQFYADKDAEENGWAVSYLIEMQCDQIGNALYLLAERIAGNAEAEGEDLAGITPNPGTYTVAEAHESDDLYFLEGIQNESFIHCLPGCIAVYFPWDVHRPSGAYEGKPITYRKVVVKVHMDLMKNSI